jgi:hypothetical protein
MKKLLTALALTVLMSGTAFANSCPTHVKKIDEALATSTASEEVKAQAQALRDEGQALHDSGDHAGSMAKLAEAEALLGIAQ